MQNKKEKLSTTLQFYFNPIEQIRMLRYFPFQTNFNDITLPLNVKQIYNKDIKVCIIIHLNEKTKHDILDKQFNSLINLNKLQNDIIVFYTKNSLSKELVDILNKYNIERIEQPESLWKQQGIGDLNILDCIYQGLSWGKDKQYDILIKLDYRLIGEYNWVRDFKQLAFDTDGITFNSYGTEWKTFRPECIGFNINWWTLTPIKYSFIWLLQNKCTVELSTWLHELAKIIDGKNYSPKKIKYMIDNHIEYQHSGYVTWLDLLGTNENTLDDRHNNVSWNKE